MWKYSTDTLIINPQEIHVWKIDLSTSYLFVEFYLTMLNQEEKKNSSHPICKR
ncbi:hypothetical protein [Candidatus Atelocyanobacterium thalassae]|uniref:Uncharacterized protein n=1 Tax=Candidatus Atelocyanobacterium thalassa isolate SIO64986 TaxID=1527444 RepID=A0A086CIS6_9CHRO|nr:hypothetical protein [Candidatus Atelocyanobacterium thalassa]KFF42090.1 MAG: hypothetical protein ucyna2_00154 [Candidatus Atelocyanobacterium thalassa isolate SIO64986]